MVDVYIALSQFAKDKFVDGGLPASRVVVKPNFIEARSMPAPARENFALFVGRFAPEKGITTLTAAFGSLSGTVPLEIIGDGPMRSALQTLQLHRVLWKGWQDSAEVLNRMRAASFLVLPSTWYEGFPVTIAEAYSVGLPVIASKLGSLAELVRDGETGLHFEAGNADDLARKVEWAYRHPEAMEEMGRRARATYESLYTSEANYAALLAIYKQAVDQRASRRAYNQ
jgi:glycosyltransferase involved in cell wall biosynthesis